MLPPLTREDAKPEPETAGGKGPLVTTKPLGSEWG